MELHGGNIGAAYDCMIWSINSSFEVGNMIASDVHSEDWCRLPNRNQLRQQENERNDSWGQHSAGNGGAFDPLSRTHVACVKI